ncbi:MAG: S53 family peptidase [Candidatus Dormibacteria bacterium]
MGTNSLARLGAVMALALASAAIPTSPALAAPRGISLAGSGSEVVAGSRDLGRASGPMRVTVQLELRNRSEQMRQARSVNDPHSPTYGKFLTPSVFDARYAPTALTVARVTRYLRAHGLAVGRPSGSGQLLSAVGDTRAIEAAFGVQVRRYAATRVGFYTAADRAVHLPAAIVRDVRGVAGLSSLEVVRHPLHDLGSRGSGARVAGAGLLPDYIVSFGPQDFWSLYNAGGAPVGRGQSLGIFATGDTTAVEPDLRAFEEHFSLPRVPLKTEVIGAVSSDATGVEEYDLDTQWSSGFAPSLSQLTMYVASSLQWSDIIPTMDTWTHEPTVRVADMSGGTCESLMAAAGLVNMIDDILARAVAQGQSFFASTGDSGSFCPAVVGVNGVPAGLPGVNFPASSPFAVGVGGTTLLTQSGSYSSEVAWYAGGGGISAMEAAPGWQQGAGGSFGGVQRGVPDVSLDADPQTGYTIYSQGSVHTVGGTSASAPSWAGIWARALEGHPGLGFAAPVLYRVPASAYRDVTLGSQGIYAATPGWDYTTGRGTPNIADLVASAG